MENCIFCKIAAGEVPSQKEHHEDEAIVSFLSVPQRAPNHTLVIPVGHYRWFYEMPDDVSNKLFKAARQLAAKLKEETGADFIKLLIEGTEVPHVHIHLLPQKTDKVLS